MIAASIAAPRADRSGSEWKRTRAPSVSSAIASQAGSPAPRPVNSISAIRSPVASSTASSTCRALSIVPVSTARAISAGPCSAASPSSSPRTSAFHSGARSPDRYGTKAGQGPAEARAASTGTSAGRQPSSRATQATEAPLDCVGPYSSGAGAQLPGTPNSPAARAQPAGAPTMADVPLKTNPLPRSKHPAAKTCANASLQPTHTGTPDGQPEPPGRRGGDGAAPGPRRRDRRAGAQGPAARRKHRNRRLTVGHPADALGRPGIRGGAAGQPQTDEVLGLQQPPGAPHRVRLVPGQPGQLGREVRGRPGQRRPDQRLRIAEPVGQLRRFRRGPGVLPGQRGPGPAVRPRRPESAWGSGRTARPR